MLFDFAKVPQHMSTESPAKSATEKENKSTMRKHKEVNCFAMSSAANGITEKARLVKSSFLRMSKNIQNFSTVLFVILTFFF